MSLVTSFASHIFVIAEVVFSLLVLVPAITLPIEEYTVYLEYGFDILDNICFFLPMPVVLSIFGVVVALQFWRIIVSILKTIWDILPIA